MKKMTNVVYLEGRLYQHKLEKRVTGENSKNPGTPYIAGTIDIATDDNITNIVTVHYTYETEKFGSGKDNSKFKVLNDIIDGKYLTCAKDGADVATKLRITSSVGVNDFYKDENGEPKLISGKRNDGGFISVLGTDLKDEKDRNRFDVDIVITGFTIKEADEENNYPEKGIIKGAIFDFRGSLLPVSFSVTNDQAIGYFESLEASPKSPVFTRIKGTEINEVIKKTVTSEGAFGDEVREVTSERRDWVVTWAQANVYDFDSEETITTQEFANAIKEREEKLAKLKGDYITRQQNKGNAIPSANASAAAATFEF